MSTKLDLCSTYNLTRLWREVIGAAQVSDVSSIGYQADFSGYNIRPKRVQMEQKKVKEVQSWPVPSTIKDLQRFLGFTNF